jgi:hypothetical protein
MATRIGHAAGRSAAPLNAALMVAALALGACAILRGGGQSNDAVAGSLIVNNGTGSEVVVYALPSTRSVGFRLGSVGSFATVTINVPRSAFQGPTDMVVRVHAIGGARDWISPRISLNDDLVARLDVRSDARGDMSQSALYAWSPPVPTEPH